MKRDGLEHVRTEKVMVPHWVRGRESAEIVEPAPHALTMLGLGDSVGTPPEGVTAEALVVKSFAELEEQAARVRGRIVVLNVPFTRYDETVLVRVVGASRAARHGAVGGARPVDRTRRTASAAHRACCSTPSDAPKIPAAAIASEDADRLQRMSDRGDRIVVRLEMEAHFEGEVESANVIGELRGREKPDEVVVVGGHLDSWDVGAGASDDGGGCIVTWEALRLMKKLGLRPRRTVRVVLWTNEENGTRGGLAYRDAHRAELPKHVAMLESDIGVFQTDRLRLQRQRPRARDRRGDRDAARRHRRRAESRRSAAAPTSARASRPHAFPRCRSKSTVLISQSITRRPTPWTRSIPLELAKCAAAVAVMTYVIADCPSDSENES